jgi:beta-phosphoglucomutase
MTRALQAIIFDFDGVIADSERLHLRAYQDVLREQSLALSADAYYERYLGYDDVGVFRALRTDLATDWTDDDITGLIARKGARYDALAAEGEMLFPGAAAFIRAAAAVVPVGIASGALSHEIHEVLARAHLTDVFQAVVGADHTARSKPNPDPYLEAFARLQAAAGRALDPSRTVAIEDSHWGLDAARAAGLRTVAVTNTYPAGEIAAAAELTVSGLDALDLETLDRLCAS